MFYLQEKLLLPEAASIVNSTAVLTEAKTMGMSRQTLGSAKQLDGGWGPEICKARSRAPAQSVSVLYSLSQFSQGIGPSSIAVF